MVTGSDTSNTTPLPDSFLLKWFKVFVKNGKRVSWECTMLDVRVRGNTSPEKDHDLVADC
jgi:hypothetical protein